jgi:hypothetical protein
MKKLFYSASVFMLAASAAQAQPSPDPAGGLPGPETATPTEPAIPAEPARPAPPADPTSDTAATPAEPASPAQPAQPTSLAATDVTDAEIDSFAMATVRLQEIAADATIRADGKQQAMVAAVAEAGLDPAKYNAIGRAAQADPELRAKVQTAMSRHAGHTDG